MAGNVKFIVSFVFLSLLIPQSRESRIHAQKTGDFRHLSVNAGLSQSTIFAIHQDSKGFIWFGTRGGGLNKYDGYDFHIYRNNPEDKNSLSDNTVLSILEDSKNVFWVGTKNGGLNRYNNNTGSFRSYSLESLSDADQEKALAVNKIHEDRQGRIWVGTNRRIYLLDREKDTFLPVLTDAPFPVREITDIIDDSEGNLYFSTWDRLIRYNHDSKEIKQLEFSPDPYSDFGGRISPLLLDNENHLWAGTPAGPRVVDLNQDFQFVDIQNINWPEPFSYIRTLIQSKDGLIWFGTRDGLYSYDKKNTLLTEYKTDPANSNSLNHNSVYSLYEDREGTLWIGTWSGISILDKRKNDFSHFIHLHNDPTSLSNNIVSSFAEDENGTWIGTEQGGLNFMNHDRTEFVSWQHKDNDAQSLPSNNVKTVFVDSMGRLWVGTFNGGLSLHLGDGKFRNYLNKHSIYTIVELNGSLYIGGRTGLKKMNLKTGVISHDVFPSSTGRKRIENFINIIFRDSQNRLWIGSRNEGLYLYDPIRESLKNFRSSAKDKTSISNDYIISVCEDKEKSIWIGSYNGLNRFNEQLLNFDRLSKRLPIEDNVINGIVDDESGHLWISTNTGLYRYNRDKNNIRHYDYLDGLQSNEFNRGACYKNSRGEMFFGGVNGFNVFHPSNIRKNEDIPPVIITDFKLFNKSVVPGTKNSPLETHISETSELVLSYRQSSFSFEFVALNFLIPEKNAYAYKLEGYDEDWNQSGRTRSASYMNLEPGKYTFKVKGSNNDNVWNEQGASIQIEVKGPWWSSAPAIFTYVFLLMGLLFVLIRIVRYRTEKENELTLERNEKSRLKELNTMRLQFFTNISHEFRTPLTLISGPLDKLISGKYSHQSEYLLSLMKSNVDRMLRLVNQLMDFRKLENEKMPLRIQSGKLDDFLSEIVLGFEDMASRKSIELSYSEKNNSASEEQWFDEGILDKVIYNLLSNAFKFTPEHGVVQVKLDLSEDRATITVKDTGKGIEPEKVKRIFERFYSDSPQAQSGTGIGLSLSKKLIDLHKGAINVESEKGKGACFIVTFPVSRSSYSENDLIISGTDSVYDRPGLSLPDPSIPLSVYTKEPGQGKFMLIVEDNAELSAYLAGHFKEFKVIQAENGKKALDLAKENIPDIIVSDIMMPEMNGIELCLAVKQEFLTSHIPVILLTAKAAVDEKIMGMETGADAYIEKPFDADLLSATVHNLLSQRKKLQQKFSGFNPPETSASAKNSAEEKFMAKVDKIITHHISEPDFSLDDLLKEIGMSRSQLYRKFKAISERNPSEYIRLLRIQHAEKLIRKNELSINEVAWQSGFNNVSYFNTCFKKHFGTTPGKYLESKSLNNS